MTTLEVAINQMTEFGLEVDYPIVDGKVHKVKYMGERRKSGWYTLHTYQNLYTGMYGSWKYSEEGLKIKRRVSINADSNELKKIKKLMAEKAQEEYKKKLEGFKEAQARSLEIWEKCEIEGSSPYLERKGITSCGARFHGSTLVIPMGREGKMRSLQSIKADGFKKYLAGGEVSGCYFIIEGSSRLALVEGFATGASINMAPGWSVAVCFTASNLIKVAPYFRKKDTIICADDDYKNSPNVGLKYGKLAQGDLNCPLLVPKFKDERGTDFNDLHNLEGLEEVKKQCLI